jgi:serine/threonine-protein kinase
MPLSPGQIVNNRYRVVKLLGQGGFGAVYKAWDLNMDRPRALKENLDTSEAAQRQFKRDAQILGDLTHPNLPKVIDHFVVPDQSGEAGSAYLVMEFVEGKDLREILYENGGPLPEAQALAWVAQICDALGYLHSQVPPIIHRDIKPANIKIRPDGRAMLVDFGIAKIYDPGLSTTAGARAVTPGFSPHEQYGQGSTDARTDLYALGATLYNLLTGQQPAESVQRIAGDTLVPPEKLNPALSPVAIAIIKRAMQIDPARRFQNAGELKTALQSGLVALSSAGAQVNRLAPVSPVMAQAAAPSQPFVKPLQRTGPKRSAQRRWFAGIGIAGMALACGLFVLAGWALMRTKVGGLPATDGDVTTRVYETLAVEGATRTAALKPVQLISPAPTTRLPTMTAWIIPTISRAATTQAAFCDHARAGSPIDVTIPDDTPMQPGQAFTKTWRLLNAGTCIWTKDYSIALFSGEAMGAATGVRLPYEVAPGQSVDVSANLIAPLTPGKYRGDWKLRNASGERFGIGPKAVSPIWLSIIVVAGGTSTVSP